MERVDLLRINLLLGDPVAMKDAVWDPNDRPGVADFISEDQQMYVGVCTCCY